MADANEVKKLFSSMSKEEQDAFVNELSDDEVQKLMTSLGPQEELNMAEKALQAAAPVLKPIGKALDYAGGVVRTAAAAPFTENIETGDVLNALLADPKSGSEILEALGVPESGSLSQLAPSLYNETGKGWQLKKGGMLDPTGRGAMGLALETVTDPLTYFTLGASKAAGQGIKKSGEAVYESGLKMIDRSAEIAGKGNKAFSKTAMKYGLTGSAEEIAEKASQLADDLYRQQQQILKEAGDMGAKVDAGRVLNRTIKKAENIASGKNIKPVRQAASGVSDVVKDVMSFGSEVPASTVKSQVASSLVSETGQPILKEVIQEVPGKVALSPLEASSIKSQLYNLLGDNAYATLAKDKGGSKLFKDAARSIKTGVESAVSKADPNLGAKLKQVNTDLGNILSSRKALQRETNKEIAKNALTSVDAALIVASPATAVSKKFGDIFKGPWARTKGGKVVRDFGQTLIEKQANPYQFMLKEALRNQSEVGE